MKDKDIQKPMKIKAAELNKTTKTVAQYYKNNS